MTSVYVSGFEYDTEETILRTHFSKVGRIQELYFQSKGSAVVTYAKEDGASRATSELDGTTIKGQTRYVAVKLDDPDRKKGSKGDKGEGKGGKTRSKGSGKGSTKSVYASGFDNSTDDYIIKKHFGKVGRIDDLYFQSNGSAVITFSDASAANRAVEELDGTTMQGQTRYVAVKLDEADRGGSKGAGKSGKGGKKGGKGSSSDGNLAVYVSGFDYNTDDASLRKHFGKAGSIEHLHFQSNGSAVIAFYDAASTNRAVEMDGTTMKGQERYVAVHLDSRSDGKGGKGKGKGKGGKGKGR